MQSLTQGQLAGIRRSGDSKYCGLLNRQFMDGARTEGNLIASRWKFMRIDKTVTDKVIAANRENAKKATGAKTQKGKDIVSQNAMKHGILAQNFLFKGEQEEAAYNRIISALEGSIDKDDPLQQLLAQEVAIGHLRRGRALNLEQKLCQRRNPATQLALDTIGRSDLFEDGNFFRGSKSRWECTELTIARKDSNEEAKKRGFQGSSSGYDDQLQLHAKFQDPLNKALRYQRATGRDFYKALDWLCRLQKERKS
jgi:hypothetical protein